MKDQTKLIFIGAISMMLLSSIIIMAVFDDVEGPFIYQVDVLPISPMSGDVIAVIIYCIDASGVSGAELSYNINDEGWQLVDMRFYACLCVAGGRWTSGFGPVSSSDTIQFYVTAFDDSPTQNPGNTETFTIEIVE
ncbi:MAG: hypothetical protein ACTSQZ_06915 [Candidatus Thorarchaeota archaeon]